MGNSLSLPSLNEPADLFKSILKGKDLLRLFVIQLRKDFQSVGLKAKGNLGKDYTFEEWCKMVQSSLEEADTQQLLNLIYRIDIPEKLFKETIYSRGTDLNMLAELIVKRELQKVVLRAHYASGKASSTE